MRRRWLLALLVLCGCESQALRPGSDAFVSDPRVGRDPVPPGEEQRLTWRPETDVAPQGSSLSWFRDAGARELPVAPLFPPSPP